VEVDFCGQNCEIPVHFWLSADAFCRTNNIMYVRLGGERRRDPINFCGQNDVPRRENDTKVSPTSTSGDDDLGFPWKQPEQGEETCSDDVFDKLTTYEKPHHRPA
jgi:hypothetical protein